MITRSVPEQRVPVKRKWWYPMNILTYAMLPQRQGYTTSTPRKLLVDIM